MPIDKVSQFIGVWQSPVAVVAEHQFIAVLRCLRRIQAFDIRSIGILLRILPAQTAVGIADYAVTTGFGSIGVDRKAAEEGNKNTVTQLSLLSAQ
jgi:hypothetical protein